MVAAVPLFGDLAGEYRSVHREDSRGKMIEEDMYAENPEQSQKRFMAVGGKSHRDNPSGQISGSQNGEHQNET